MRARPRKCTFPQRRPDRGDPSTGHLTRSRSEGAVHQDWFVDEGDGEGLVDLGLDVGGQGEEVFGGGGASVGEGEGVFGGDGGGAEGEAFGDAGVFDEPGGAGFGAAVGLGPLGGAGGDFGGGGEEGVGEEGAGAPGVVVGGVEDHAFAAAEGEDGFADVGHGGAGAGGDVEDAGQFGVADGGGEVAELELEGDLQYDVALRGRLEHRGAVREAAVGGEDRADL